MSTHLDALEHLTAELTGAGVLADHDPRNLRPPCVWIAPRTLDPADTYHGARVVVDLYLIARDTGADAAHTVLTGLLGDCLSVAPAEPDTTVALDEAVTLSTGGPLPAYRYTTALTYC